MSQALCFATLAVALALGVFVVLVALLDFFAKKRLGGPREFGHGRGRGAPLFQGKMVDEVPVVQIVHSHAFGKASLKAQPSRLTSFVAWTLMACT